MADLTGLRGFNKAGTSTNLLLAGYGNDVINIGTGLGYGLNLNSENKVEMDVFLDRLFIQNYDTRPKTFDGTTWTNDYVGRCLTSKFIKSSKSQVRIYLGYCKFTAPQVPLDTSGNEITFPSRVFYSDLFVGNNLTWGMEWGRNGRTTQGSPFFNIDQPLVQDFVASNIKVGDPLIVTSGDSTLVTKTYYVKNVISPYRLEMTENFPVTASSLHYWVGSNWFDVGPDDNDSVTGFGEYSSNFLVYKLYSLYSYNRTSLRPIPDALGTSSNRSILVTKSGVYYFHGSDPKISGIYRYDGSETSRVSRAIDPYIRGMSSANYTEVVGWREGEELRWYLGNLTNSNYDIDMDKAVATINTGISAWDVSPIADEITCATEFQFGNEQQYYTGNSEGQVLKMGTGNNFNGDPIRYRLETKVYYPEGIERILEMDGIQVVGRQTKGLRIYYKLWDNPNGRDDEWLGIGELNNDLTELLVNYDHKFASGIQFAFEGFDILENDLFVEKFNILYKEGRIRRL